MKSGSLPYDWLRRDRTVMLVDIENVAGKPRLTASETRWIAQALAALTGDRSVQTIVACNRLNAAAVMFGYPGARIRLGSGPDAADLALIAVMEHESLSSRFDRVIIASGDGIFADYAAQLAGAGLHVTAVVGNGQLSKRLRLAVHDVTCLWSEPEQLPRSGIEASSQVL